MGVREQFGHHIKSGASYVYERDTRDHRVFANHGYSFKVLSELAGLGGDVKYLKGDIKANYSLTIFKDLVSPKNLDDFKLFIHECFSFVKSGWSFQSSIVSVRS